ncbi:MULTISPECIES: hypothetical protein [Bacillus]|uniref:hypothetical protein n=1 Tax=Bacillus TaxID=1386 RepID=UPI001CDB84E7|nr:MULTISPECIES: hypothetical protein [Bacillus]MCY9310108.1 hypothetical protein [Bacillus inaquosorum]
MALEYKILWFEDNSDVIEDNKPEIEKFVNEKGFTLDVTVQEDSKNIEDILNEEFDLILSDINLTESENGNEIVSEMRKRHIYTEVLFYSGIPNEIYRIIKEESIERASFCAGIENLLDKINQIISLTIRKLQEVNSIRGLFMSETSEMDVKMTEIITSLINSFDENEIIDKKQELLTKVIQNRRERLEKMEQVDITCDMKNFIERLESSDRISTINRLVKAIHNKKGDPVFSNNKKILNDYNEEIIKVRNNLAHAKLVNDNGVKKIISTHNGVEVKFDDASCNKMRKDVRKHTDNLNDIIRKIPSL